MEPQDTIFLKGRDIADPAERAAYLAQACGDDAALRQRVEAMLRDAARADEFFGPEPAGATVTEGPGTVIGRYKLLQKIGEGGMGVVYMAEQREPVIRKVALKIIKLGMDTRQVVARFEAECQALALMDHPNIAKVLDGGATKSGRPYFVMDLVPGLPITQFCDEASLPTRERLELFLEVCSAVQHAHQKGIIHRDLKPSNILVTLHGDKPVPKVIDFGVAKATAGRLTEKTLFTQFQQFIGTPAYMSPEQASLSGLDVDTRSDIYGLGVLLYELLTGRTPFDGKELLKAGLDEMRRTIRETEPPRPSNRISTLQGEDLTNTAQRRHTVPPKLIHLVRGDLDWIVMKALEKDRARRYETANGLAMDIKRHLTNEPIVARPPSRLYKFQKTVRRHKFGFAAAALMTVVLVAATGISAWQAVRATRAQAEARDRLADSEVISKFLIEVFKSPSPLRDGRTITVAETLSNATQKLGTELTNQPARWAKLQSAIGETYFNLGLYRDAIPFQEKVRDYYLSASGPKNPDTLVATRRLARLYMAVGRQDEAIKLLEQVLPLSRKVLGSENPDTINTIWSLAGAYDQAGRVNETLKLLEEALALNRKVNGPEHPMTIMTMEELANAYLELDRLNEAITMGEQALTNSVKVLGPQSPQTLSCMVSLAGFYYQSGRRDEGLMLLEQALPLEEKVNGPDYPVTIKTMRDLAYAYDDAGRREDALKLREQVLTRIRKTLGPDHPETFAAMQNLAISYDEVGRQDEALKLLEQAVELSRNRLGAEHPYTLRAEQALALLYNKAGRKDEATKLGEEVLALKRKVLGPAHHETLAAMDYLAQFYEEAGRHDESLKLREQALPLYLKGLGPKNPDTLQAIGDLAKGYEEVGRYDEALKLLEQTLTLDRKALGPQDPVTLKAINDLAWFQATSEAAETRNGTNAVFLAEEAVAATQRKNPGYLDTLAAAYAESQQFDKAVAVEQEAIGLLKSEPEKKDYASHLKLYQANQPCRIISNP